MSIAKKYLGYALIATAGGSVLGVLIGEKILPEGKKIAGPRTPYRQSIRIFYRFIGEVSGNNLREMQANRDREEAAHAAGM